MSLFLEINIAIETDFDNSHTQFPRSPSTSWEDYLLTLLNWKHRPRGHSTCRQGIKCSDSFQIGLLYRVLHSMLTHAIQQEAILLPILNSVIVANFLLGAETRVLAAFIQHLVVVKSVARLSLIKSSIISSPALYKPTQNVSIGLVYWQATI